MAETLYDLWAKKNPDFEVRFEPLLRQYCDYGKGYNEYTESKAKILGALKTALGALFLVT